MMKFPDEVRYGKSLRENAGLRQQARNQANQWISKKDIAWTSLSVLVIAILTSGDVLWSWLEEGASLLFEMLSEGLESFFMKVVGFNHHNAQVATAYLDFAIVSVVGVILGRKIIVMTKRAKAKGSAWWKRHVSSWQGLCQAKVNVTKSWWDRLNWLNKCVVILALLILAVPMAMVLSIGLGMVVVEFL